MTLLTAESFDPVTTVTHLIPNSTADQTRKWTAGITNSHFTFTAGFTDQALRFTTTSSSNFTPDLRLPFPESATVIAGWRARFVVQFTSSNEWALTAADGASRIRIRVSSDGSVRLINTAGSEVASSLAGIIVIGNWYYIEIKAAFGTSAAVEIRVNEVVVISATGVNTKGASASTGFGFFGLYFHNGLGTGSATRQVDQDDIYICNALGTKNNNYLGTCQIFHAPPDGNGAHSDWLGSDADQTDNYLHLDETTSIDDNDYIESSVVDDIDSHAYTDVAIPAPVIPGVVVNHRLVSVGGTRDTKSFARLSASEVESGALGSTTSLDHYVHVFELDPAGADWVAANVNLAEFGVKTA